MAINNLFSGNAKTKDAAGKGQPQAAPQAAPQAPAGTPPQQGQPFIQPAQPFPMNFGRMNWGQPFNQALSQRYPNQTPPPFPQPNQAQGQFFPRNWASAPVWPGWHMNQGQTPPQGQFFNSQAQPLQAPRPMPAPPNQMQMPPQGQFQPNQMPPPGQMPAQGQFPPNQRQARGVQVQPPQFANPAQPRGAVNRQPFFQNPFENRNFKADKPPDPPAPPASPASILQPPPEPDIIRPQEPPLPAEATRVEPAITSPAAADGEAALREAAELERLLEDDRNAAEYYRRMSEDFSRSRHSDVIGGLAVNAAAREEPLHGVYKGLKDADFEFSRPKIYSPRSVADGAALAIREESRNVRRLCGLYENAADPARARVYNGQILRRLSDLQELNMMLNIR